MKEFLFQNREGQTPLHPDYRFDLLPKNLQTFGELNEHEEQNIALGLSWLERQSVDGLDHLFWRKLHQELFRNVWGWAGKVRKAELHNEEFLPVKQIETAIRQLEGDLQYWLEARKLKGEEIAARFHERLLTIHPFPNGNGRFSRILTTYVCQRHGLPVPTWKAAEPNQSLRRKTYVEAIVKARKEKDFVTLSEFMFS